MINDIHISNAVTDSQLQPMTEASPDSNTLLLRFIIKQFSWGIVVVKALRY